MKAPVRSFIIRDATRAREAETLVLGRGLRITETAGGLPELEGLLLGETQLMPSGGDDTQAIRDALATGTDVRLGPGTFAVSDTLALGAAGGGQRLVGSGKAKTQISFTGSGIPAIDIVSGHCSIESLRVAGAYSAGQTGIRSLSGGPVKLRDLTLGPLRTAIHLENAAGCEVDGVDIGQASEYGIYTRGLSRSTIRNVVVGFADTTGIHIENGTGVSCEAVQVNEAVSYGVYVTGGSGHRLAGIRTVACEEAGIAIVGAAQVACESLFAVNGYAGVVVEQARDVSLAACTALGVRDSLVIRNSTNVVAGAICSDKSVRTFPTPTHVLVNGSAGVFVTGMRVFGTATVDVSAAGSRVLFGPNNFAPGSIVSGGNFAAL
ncbi:MAG: right-handed parallel beta-helix repeat-containing protein [Longimicrobiaceae bacterium]